MSISYLWGNLRVIKSHINLILKQHFYKLPQSEEEKCKKKNKTLLFKRKSVESCLHPRPLTPAETTDPSAAGKLASVCVLNGSHEVSAKTTN